MLRVMIVDDEPAAMRYIAQLLRTRCPDTEIVCCVEDGKGAISALRQTQVDIVITDIQMSAVNGIELAQWISRHKPDVLTLIISGHSNFEYAKAAISAGVSDYLLKPIRPSEFKAAMDKLGAKAKQQKRQGREGWLLQILKTSMDPNNPWPWSQDRLTLGAIRLGGTPCDARMPTGPFPYPPGLPDDLAAVYARDETEVCFALPVSGLIAKHIGPGHFVDVLSLGAPYYTAFLKTVLPGEDSNCLLTMLDATLKAAVPGLKQAGELGDGVVAPYKPPQQEQTLLSNLRYAISNAQLDKIKAGLGSAFALWEADNAPLSHVERTLAHLLQFMTEHTPPSDDKPQGNLFEVAVTISRQAASYSDMLQRAWEYCGKIYKPIERKDKGGQLIGRIEEYIHEHLRDPLSTQLICDVFHISGSYLSQLFRKYCKMTFVEYVTHSRIEEAKLLMTEFPDMPIKAIAAHLGFSDQFYFSKVFRSITGLAPSEFKSG
ncbi:MAG: response regulator [Oscillospiraceae bacterium]|nr:response regulator [Oscillospiraceae bacterium]